MTDTPKDSTQSAPPAPPNEHSIVSSVNEVTRDRTSFFSLFLPALIACALATTCSHRPDIDGVKTKVDENRSELRALQAELKEARRENQQILEELRAQKRSASPIPRSGAVGLPTYPPGYVPGSTLPLSPPIAPSESLQGSPF